MTEREDMRRPAVGSAADWYVDFDAEPADASAAAELAAWLARDERNEAGFERCEAAVWLAARLKNDPDLDWAFAETEALARETGRRRLGAGAWAGRGKGAGVLWALAAGFAAVALTTALWPRGPESTPRALIDEAIASTSPVVLPGEVVVDAGSVAVLPFVNLSRSPADGSVAAHFDAGLAADLHAGIVAELGAAPGVRVTNRHAVMPYAGLDLPPNEVAARLGVRGIVSGSLRSEAGRVDVDVELLDAADGRRLWALHASRHASELEAVRAEIVGGVAAALTGGAGR